jgi:hypothetical protein
LSTIFLVFEKKIKKEKSYPIAEFFILFATYGGLLIVTITTLSGNGQV